MEVVTRPSGNAALSGGREAARSFDLNSWKGLTEVLKAARESGMDPDAYGDFRDKVLSYAQSGGDAELKKEIDAVLKTLKPSGQRAAPKVNRDSEPTSESAPKGSEPEPETNTGQQTESATQTERRGATPATRAEDTVSEPAPVPVRNAEAEAGIGDKNDEEGKPVPDIGHTRPTPTFNLSQQRKTVPATEAQHPEAASQASEKPVTETSSTRSAASSAATKRTSDPSTDTTPTPQQPEPANEPSSGVQEQQTTAAPQPDAKPSPGMNAPSVPEPAAPQPTAPEPALTPTAGNSSKSVAEYKQRIAEIKRDVNARVGNPVTLIDAGNEVGREYMNALLRAMRATAGGKTGDLSSAMGELEIAYRKIIEAAPSPADETRGEAPPTEQPAQTDAPPQSAESALSSTTTDDTVRAPGASVSVDPEHSATPNKITVMPSAARQGEAAGAVHDQPQAGEAEPAPEAPPTPQEPAAQATSKPAGRTSIPSLADELSSEVPTGEHHGKIGYGSAEEDLVSEDAPDSETAEPPTASAAPTPQQADTSPQQSAPVDELHTEEVNAGLEQLLNEWKLFKSSGFFGTGPGGTEHPLFKQLGPLSMSSIITGRFEKADNNVIQSIKDYTNAWRHEQGISYTPSETFEHYLRRVVARILKRQRG